MKHSKITIKDAVDEDGVPLDPVEPAMSEDELVDIIDEIVREHVAMMD
jgi:hypothetical protein